MDGRVVERFPPKLTYIPNFISCEEEQTLLERIYDSPKAKWTQLSNRRLQNWGEDADCCCLYHIM